jgi:hypothetical protein
LASEVTAPTPVTTTRLGWMGGGNWREERGLLLTGDLIVSMNGLARTEWQRRAE